MSAFDLVRVGTHVSVGTRKKPFGSLGGVVELSNGTYAVVTAGHVVHMAGGADLIAASATTSLSIGKPIVTLYDDTEDADIALVGPVEGDVANVSGDLVFVRNPNIADLNTQVQVYVLRDLAPVSAYVHGIDVPASFFRVNGPGKITIEGLVSIDAVTEPGDSGGPVLDDMNNLIGFVVGSDGLRTYLMPAERGLDALTQHAR